MKLKNIIVVPAKYKNREDKIRELILTNVKYIFDYPDLTISGIINQHMPTVKFLQPNHIDLNSNILIDCSCESFKYEFAYPNKDNLIYPNKYIDKKPTQKNIYLIQGACKHIYALGRYIFSNKNKILEKMKGAKYYE